MNFKLLLVNLVQILVNSSVTREFYAFTREFAANTRESKRYS
ncbi:hypothetical protein OCO53_10770 [Peribacillus frigoritolerans]|nr:hypothetical protein [Peribacillus frigoritolerans]MCU6600949.1 hypothetical protein [Peribacillus frigoritolerans]